LHRLGPGSRAGQGDYERDANSRYLPGFKLPRALKATADLEKAVHDVDLLYSWNRV
jgi:glycerol-3-phosphate dehydrogenase